MTERPASTAWTGQTGRATRLLLLRHGQTPLSVDRRYSGRSDPDLTDVGREQAAAAAARLAGLPDVTAVLSSPLRRTRHTAEPAAAALGLPVRAHDGLLETDFGGWDGLTFAEARVRDPELHGRWLGHPDVAPPGGESLDAVGARVAATRDELLAEFAGSTVLLVTHVTPIKMLLRDALGAGPGFVYRCHLDLASLSVADHYPDGGASVRLVNDIGHLGPQAGLT